MARSVWSGSLGFGLVNVSVKLYTATEDRDVRFHQFDAESGERVRHQRVTEDGKEVDYDDIQKGYEVSPGNHVMVTREELESVEPARSASIVIEDFVPLSDIDPIYFRTTYYVVPADPDVATTSYRLLRAAMDEEQRVGIGRFVMRGKQHLAAIRPSGPRLVLETMFFGDEVRDPAQLDDLADLEDDDELPERELSMARKLVESLSTDWDASRYADTHREQVLELIHRKAEGEDIVTEPAKQPEETKVVDLMSVLEASIDEARHGRTQPRTQHQRSESMAGTRRSGGRRRSARRDWARLSKNELYGEAARHDISGRSRMSKDELIEALQKAS